MPPTPSNAPLILSGPPRSGTTFFSALLDGHSRINWFLDEGFFFEHLHDLGEAGHHLFVNAAKADVDGFIEGIRDRSLFPPTHVPPVDFPELKYRWSEDAFRQKLDLSRVVTARDLWNVVSHAYLAGFGYGDRSFICMKAADYGRSVAGALRYFEEARGIIIVRAPLPSLNSLKRYREKRGAKLLTWPTLTRAIAEMNHIPEIIRAAGKDRIRVVRYEDFSEDAGPTMESICAWLGIPMEAVCRKATMMGVDWTNNSSFELPAGASTAKSRRPELFSAAMKQYIHDATKPFREAFGY